MCCIQSLWKSSYFTFKILVNTINQLLFPLAYFVASCKQDQTDLFPSKMHVNMRQSSNFKWPHPAYKTTAGYLPLQCNDCTNFCMSYRPIIPLACVCTSHKLAAVAARAPSKRDWWIANEIARIGWWDLSRRWGLYLSMHAHNYLMYNLAY